MANQYLIVEDAGLTLIDTGLRDNYRSIINGIHSIGRRLSDLKTILITHADGDHYGALPRIQAMNNARTLASQPEADAIRTGSSSREMKQLNGLQKTAVHIVLPMFRTTPASVDRILRPGEKLDILGGMNVLDSAGHTPGHLSFYLPERDVLFSGDSIFFKKGSFIPSYGFNCWDETRAATSMQAQLRLKPKIICGGHSVYWPDPEILKLYEI